VTPLWTGTGDIACLLVLSIFRCYKLKWTRMSRKSYYRTIILAVISLVCIANTIQSILQDDYPYISNFLRPIVVIVFSSSIRATMKQVLFNAKDAFAILATIFLFIGFFTISGYYLFRGTIMGYQNFTSFGATYYQLTILLTTTNFPDVMLPAYYANTFYVIFFIVYLVLGLYFLSNMLLATIFSGYKQKMQEKVLQISDKRLIYLEKYYNMNDMDKKGYLKLTEIKKFFSQVLNLDYKKEDDRISFKKIMRIVDPQKTFKVQKDTIMDFFMMPGFMDQIRPQQEIAVEYVSHRGSVESITSLNAPHMR
jgi:two pore calcium channel protein